LVAGDAGWEVITQISTEDAAAYLTDRKGRGFNSVLVNLIEHKGTTHSPPWANAYGVSPFSNAGDFSTYNTAYFDHAADVIGKAQSLGLLVFLFPAYIGYGCGDEGWCAEMRQSGTSRLTQYGQFLGTRFKSFNNIIWVDGGDFLPGAAELDLISAIANGIRTGDAGSHLHTAHWSRRHAATDIPNLPWLNIDTTYTGADQTLADSLINYSRDAGVRPFFLIEAQYENESGGSGRILRSQIYQSVLAGSTGFFSGTDPVWYFGNPGDGNPAWAFYSGGTQRGWKSMLASSGALYVTRAVQALTGLAWQTLKPDTAHLLMPADSQAALASSANGRLAVSYLTSNHSITVDLSRITGSVQGTWIDPVSGQRTSAGSFTTHSKQSFSPPGNNSEGAGDWLLVLQGT
jgi:hypothetical protein